MCRKDLLYRRCVDGRVNTAHDRVCAVGGLGTKIAHRLSRKFIATMQPEAIGAAKGMERPIAAYQNQVVAYASGILPDIAAAYFAKLLRDKDRRNVKFACNA